MLRQVTKNSDEENLAERFFNASEALHRCDVVTELMAYSRYGTLAQTFVMEAPSEKLVMMGNAMVMCEAWKDVAAEINEKFARYRAKV